jgi:hypothetical protein
VPSPVSHSIRALFPLPKGRRHALPTAVSHGFRCQRVKHPRWNRTASKKPANTGWRALLFSRKARLRRGRAGGCGCEAGGIAAVPAVIRNHDGNSGNNGSCAKPDNQRTGADFLSRLNASGLTGRQYAVSGESRSCNHRRHCNRGNNTFKTKHLASPVLYGGILVRSCNPSQRPVPNSFLTVAKRLYRIAGHAFSPAFEQLRIACWQRFPTLQPDPNGFFDSSAVLQSRRGAARTQQSLTGWPRPDSPVKGVPL